LFVFFDLYCVFVCIFVIYIDFFPYCLFVSNSQVIGCEDRLQNDLFVEVLHLFTIIQYNTKNF